MPKETNILPNLRVDIPDFKAQTSEFTKGLWKQHGERAFLDNFSAVIDGFRVEIADQTGSPGQFTIVNGAALSRNGDLVNNENDYVASRSHTLVANGTYYIEIELINTESDTDSRAFWDPTYDNGTDPSGDVRPPGREYNENVSTRITPDWQIVTPVSTTGFTFETDPDTNKIPIAVLQVALGKITGGTTATFRTLLTKSVTAGTTSLVVVDGRLIRASDTIRLDPGGSNQEDVVVTTVDNENGVVNLSGLGTTKAHTIRTRVQVLTTSAPVYLIERLDPQIPTTGTEDARTRLFAGNEERGSILSQNPTLADIPENKNDANVINLKRYVDFLASELRELKFGSPAASLDAAVAPPSSFANPVRYYDRSGGVQGARLATVSIGDGVSSWGDFNVLSYGDFLLTLTAAIAALPSAGGIVYIKNSNAPYTFSAYVGFTGKANIHIIGESVDGVNLQYASTSLMLLFDSSMTSGSVSNLTVSSGSISTDTTLTLDNVKFNNGSLTGNGLGSVIAKNADFTFSSGTALNGSFINSVFENCSFTGNQGAVLGENTDGVTFLNCSFEGVVTALNNTNAINTKLVNCKLTLTGTTTTNRIVNLTEVAADGNVDLGTTFDQCVFTGTVGPTSWISATNVVGIRFRDCTFAGGNNTVYVFDVTTDSVGIIGDIPNFVIEGCRFDTLNAIKATTGAQGILIKNNTFTFGTHASINANGAVLDLANMDNVFVLENTFTQTTAGSVSSTGLTDTFSTAIHLNTSHFEISNNFFNNVDVAIHPESCTFGTISNNRVVNATDYGIAFLFSDEERGGFALSNITISNNVVHGINALGANAPEGASSIGVVGFILLMFGSTALTAKTISKVTIANNNVETIGSNITAKSRGYGIYIDSGGTNGLLNIQNNTFSNIQSPAGAIGPACIYLKDTVSYKNINIQGNIFTSIGNSGTVSQVLGIYIYGVPSGCNISNNLFDTFGNASATIGSYLIQCNYSAQQITICNNIARNIVYSGTALSGIFVNGWFDCNISNNIINCASTYQLGTGIELDNLSTAINAGNTVISGNSLPQCDVGLSLDFDGVGTGSDVNHNCIISHNSVFNYDSFGIFVGGSLTEGVSSSITIIGNCLFTADVTQSSGIYCTGVSRIVCNSNNIGTLRGLVLFAGQAIDFDDHNGGSFVGNSIVGRFTNGIDIAGVDFGVVGCNVIDMYGGVSGGVVSTTNSVITGPKTYVVGNTMRQGTGTFVTLGTDASQRAQDDSLNGGSPDDPDALTDINMNYKRIIF